MSETLRETVPAQATTSHGSPWGHWRNQALAVMRLELRKSFLGKRVFLLLVLALMPVFLLAMRAIISEAVNDPANLAEATKVYSAIYQAFTLRVIVFLGCVWIFGNLIRREVLDRSLHYYFLSPMRREVLVVAKYLIGVVVAIVLFGSATLISYLLAYAPHTGVSNFFFRGPGLAHLGSYLLVTALACMGYGAVFLALGFFFKSPAIPALAVFGWERILFLLPPLLKKVSVAHYLQSLCPVPFDEGPLAILADAPSPWISIPGLFLLSAVLLAISAKRIKKMEISYEED
ncbi:MAG: type transport system permease protein [Acidobacteriota bacterium]|nr:type transport system permease protein [Acidobacteriota bacterium]